MYQVVLFTFEEWLWQTLHSMLLLVIRMMYIPIILKNLQTIVKNELTEVTLFGIENIDDETPPNQWHP